MHRDGRKGTQKRARKHALLGPRWFREKQRKCFGKNGGDDGTRTRGLCRDSLGIHVLSATYVLSVAAKSLKGTVGTVRCG